MKNRRTRLSLLAACALVGTSVLAGCGTDTSEDGQEIQQAPAENGTDSVDAVTDPGLGEPDLVSDTEENVEQAKEREDILPHEEGEYVVFGAYEQDNDLTNGPEPVEWIVVDKNENGTLLMSRYVLEAHAWQPKSNFDPANDENWREKLTWEQSELRQWMNSEFKDALFTEKEQSYINLVTLENPDYPDGQYYIDVPPTEDYLFVLSVHDILKYFDYVETTWQPTFYSGYFQDLVCTATPYAHPKVFHDKVENNLDYEQNHLADYGYSEDIIGVITARYWTRSSLARGPWYRSAVGYAGYCGWSEGRTAPEKTNDLECDKTNGGVRPCVYVNF